MLLFSHVSDVPLLDLDACSSLDATFDAGIVCWQIAGGLAGGHSRPRRAHALHAERDGCVLLLTWSCLAQFCLPAAVVSPFALIDARAGAIRLQKRLDFHPSCCVTYNTSDEGQFLASAPASFVPFLMPQCSLCLGPWCRGWWQQPEPHHWHAPAQSDGLPVSSATHSAHRPDSLCLAVFLLQGHAAGVGRAHHRCARGLPSRHFRVRFPDSACESSSPSNLTALVDVMCCAAQRHQGPDCHAQRRVPAADFVFGHGPARAKCVLNSILSLRFAPWLKAYLVCLRPLQTTALLRPRNSIMRPW